MYMPEHTIKALSGAPWLRELWEGSGKEELDKSVYLVYRPVLLHWGSIDYGIRSIVIIVSLQDTRASPNSLETLLVKK